jgi:hypothetical protein
MPEQKGESLNLSRQGIYFATDAPFAEGEAARAALEYAGGSFG